MTFFVCVSLPVLGGKTSTISAAGHHAHDALTNAYIQCVENKMPVEAAKLYNIPNTTLRDRLSGRVHKDTLLLHIEMVLFSPIMYFMKVECC